MQQRWREVSLCSWPLENCSLHQIFEWVVCQWKLQIDSQGCPTKSLLQSFTSQKISNCLTYFFHRSFQQGCLIVLIFCKVMVSILQSFQLRVCTILIPPINAGLCNSDACPYRHVHVNPSAAICDGFLKGYCSDGDEVRIQLRIHCTVWD